MLGLAGSRKRDLALGQLCFCWAGRSKFLFLTHYETREQHRSNLCRGGESCFSLSCPSSAKEGGLTPPAPAQEERGLLAGLGWMQPEYSLVYARGSPAGTAVGQRSTKFPFSVKDPAQQVFCVQLFKGISVKGHSYSKLQERRVRGSQAVSESHRNKLPQSCSFEY